MGSELSMGSRVEITTRYAKAYAAASKSEKGRVLDEVVSVTGWSRDNARRRLTAAAASPPGSGRQVARRPRKPRRPKFSYDARKVLQRVWAATGGQCGKYLVVSMRLNLDLLQAHDKLVFGAGRYSESVRVELLSMSAASIDRYLQGAKASDPLTKGASTTKPSPLLRSSITIRKAGDEVEAEPGFFEGDTVAHCGPSLKGEFARTVNLTCVHTGWVFTTSVRNNAHTHILAALNRAVSTVPFEVVGLDFDNGSEFLNHGVIDWAAGKKIFFTRSRPYKKNDQATIESKNNHLARKYAFHYRYDTAEELKVLNRLWPLVNDRLNYLTPTKKPIGYGTDKHGKRTRLYDTPTIPFDRLLAAGVLSRSQQAAMTTYRNSLDPDAIAHQIADLQTVLMKLAAEKTNQLYLAAFPSALPDVRKGIRVKAS
jgi:hypothetical protein